MIKGDIGVAITADTSLINTRLDELEDKVSKMEQWLINLQTITDILIEDLTARGNGVDVVAVEVKEEPEAAAAAEPAETAAIEDAIVSQREKEERAKKISKIAADKIRKAKAPDKLAPQIALMSNKLHDFI